MVDALCQIADAHDGASPSQVAINWLLARPGVTSVLIGATAEDQLRDLFAATRWSLTGAEVALLQDASAIDPGYPWSQRARFHPERNPDPFA